MTVVRIGVLSLQGAFIEHVEAMEKLGQKLLAERRNIVLEVVQVRTQDQLSPSIIDGLILPGGESTTMMLAAQRLGLWEALQRWIGQDGRPTMGTCAGLILMANEVSHQKEGGQESLGGLGLRVDRNYYGRQSDSFQHELYIDESVTNSIGSLLPSAMMAPPTKVFFIRAPMINSITTEKISVLARLPRAARLDKNWLEDPIVAVRQGDLLGLTFHPELTLGDLTWHAYFLSIILNYK